MGRSPCCDKLGLKKGPWTPEEDHKLLAYIEEHGHGNWRALPSKAGLQRCGKSCRLRWTNYLRPDIKRGKFSLQEEQTIIQLHALLGNRWSAIATHLPKRTDNEIKNYWNTHLKKRLAKMGIDPVTHKPKNDALLSAADCGPQQSKNVANLSHMAQWESARLEAEARLARQSKLRSNASSFASTAQVLDREPHVLAPLSSSSPPRCGLDVFKAWHNVWPNNDDNNNSNNNVMTATNDGTGIGIGIGFESPTSTLSFMGNGGVIEFMGHNNGANSNNNTHANYHHQEDQEIVKEETHHHQHQQQQQQWNSLTFIDMAAHIDSAKDSSIADDEAGDDEDSNPDPDPNSDDRSFMDGFTELLLSTTTTTITTTTRTSSSNGKSMQEENRGTHNSNNGSSSGTTNSSAAGSEYYEDNKNYWNSILNLVNSSPPHPPIF